MRTAIISDLHLGVASDEDVLRDPNVRRVLLEEIAGADSLVLLGDVVELRNLPVGPSLERSRPFFEELGEALGDDALVTWVPGNHDARFVEPMLDELSIRGNPTLSLQNFHLPYFRPVSMIDEWLGDAHLQIAYPGVWLREDVYATHGHYMDVHLTLPRAECVAAATMVRLSKPLPPRATPNDYERVLRPLYGFAYGLAQVMPVRRRRNGPFEKAWEVLSGERRGGFKARAARAGFPWAIRGLNSLLRAEFEPDVTAQAIFRSGVEAAIEMTHRLGIDDVHVITGHTHRPGPLPGEPEWPLPGGGWLHNTGSWVFSSAFHQPGTPPNSYWPGTVTWLEDDDPPRRVQLLQDHSHAQMTALVNRASRQ